MRNLRALTAAVLFSFATAVPATELPTAAPEVREAFIKAWGEVPAFVPPAQDPPELRRYVLFPYLEGERLRTQLGRVAPDARDAALEEQAFKLLIQLGDQPVANGVWQTLLGYYGRRSAWREFLSARARYPDRSFPTENLKCYEFSARLATQQTKGLREAVFEQWESSGTPSEACAPVYAWIDNADHLSVEQIERRARQAGKKGVAMPQAYASLPESRRQLLEWLRRVDRSPTAALNEFIKGDPAPLGNDGRTAEMVRAFERVARSNSERAKPLFPKLFDDKRFTPPQREVLRRDYALGLAYDRDAEAVRQFEQVPLSVIDERSHEWRLRSAVWNGKWKLVERWLGELPPEEAKSPRWLYWRGRMEALRGQGEAARKAWTEAAREREYYAFLSAERLGRPADLRHKPLPEDWPTLDLLASTPALQRARELLACDLPDLAALEFNHALRNLPADAKPQAIRLAANWGWHDRAVILQAQLGLWDDLWLRFPLPFEGEVEAAARETGIPPNWLYAVMRTESLYNPRAMSHAGARGLLQLMPRTATAVAGRAGFKRPSNADLFRPEINVALGARYLREMTERFSGRLILTLAAYNAGPHRVNQWLPERPVDGDIWVENIPYNETREYVQRALSSLVMIGWRRSGEAALILPLLDPIHAKLEKKK